MENTLLVTTPHTGITIITFNRPQALNALNLATMWAFQHTIQQIAQDDSLRVVILTGAGERAFCSGGDLAELRHKPSAQEGLEMVSVMGDALLQLERLPVPIIGAINGYALGGGSEIAMACDMRVVDEAVKMGFVQINMALTPGWGAGQRLLHLVGYAKALELLLSGEPLNAQQAVSLGLANHVAPTGTALSVALQLAQSISQRPTDVVKSIKALLQAGKTLPYETALQHERALFPALWEAPAHIEAVENFFKKQAEKK